VNITFEDIKIDRRMKGSIDDDIQLSPAFARNAIDAVIKHKEVPKTKVAFLGIESGFLRSKSGFSGCEKCRFLSRLTLNAIFAAT
jgi:hypothetical protein